MRWQNATLPFIRGRGPFASPGGMTTDWNLHSNIEGLFAAGNALFAGNYYHHAAVTGRYAGRKAASYAKSISEPVTDQDQIEREKQRVYAPVTRTKGIDWKELRAGLCRVMQNYCSDIKNEEMLTIGLNWLQDYRENVLPDVYASNPHMLMRVLEGFNMLECDELIIKASLARKASSKYLGFARQDYLQEDPSDWHKFITIKQNHNGIETGKRDLEYADPLNSNYERYNSAYRGYLKQS